MKPLAKANALAPGRLHPERMAAKMLREGKEKAGKKFAVVPLSPEDLGRLKKNRNRKKFFIAEKQETSYYRFCGYGNYENTYLFVH